MYGWGYTGPGGAGQSGGQAAWSGADRRHASTDGYAGPERRQYPQGGYGQRDESDYGRQRQNQATISQGGAAEVPRAEQGPFGQSGGVGTDNNASGSAGLRDAARDVDTAAGPAASSMPETEGMGSDVRRDERGGYGQATGPDIPGDVDQRSRPGRDVDDV